MPIFVGEEQIRQRLSYEELIPALRSALIDYSAGLIQQPLRPIIAIPEHAAWFSVMPAVMGDVMGAKLVSVFPENARLGLHTHLAVIALFSARTGELIAVMDGRLITEMRTAAVSAIATDALAPQDSRVLAILGSGIQARAHRKALGPVRKFEEVRVWSRNAAHAQAFAEESGALVCESAEDAVRGADVVVTATNSAEPILRGEWLKPGSHVNAVGAVGAQRRELDAAAVEGAYVVVESRVSAASEAGDLLMAGIAADAELGELLAGDAVRRAGRSIYKSVGIAVEDLAAARLAV